MLLKQLKLRNFGTFGGENTFDLTLGSNGDKPVILIRGHNGGGKTTFLEAVRLALYGKRALGARIARMEYEDYLKQRIYGLSDDHCASVELTFSRQDQGESIDFTVTRSWILRGDSVSDSIELTREGLPVLDTPEEDWDYFLEDMIPSGISQLFFFDGERIQDVANNDSGDGLKDAIKSLLGLDLVNQLRSDLTIYTTRRSPATGCINLETIEQELNHAREELVLLEEEVIQDQTHQQQASVSINQAQRKFHSEGGIAALDRTFLKTTLKEAEKRTNHLQGDLRNLVEGHLPLALAPRLLERFVALLENQRRAEHSDAISAFLDELARSRLSKDSKKPIFTATQLKASKQLLKLSFSDRKIVKLDADPSWILGRLHLINDDLQERTAYLAAAIDDAKQNQSRLKEQLKGFDADAAKSALEDLKVAEYQLGVAETRLGERSRHIAGLRNRINSLEKDRTRAISVEFDVRLANHKVELGERTRAALSEYETRLTQCRLANLSRHFVMCFNRLIQKKYLVRGVNIDPNNFEISLIGIDGTYIKKETLSAGERQILAISMLWALGKTSGRQLPIIIDTPLARLDRHHRRAILEAYVPYASRQIILLCSDSELTEDLDQLIAPFVARRYEIGINDISLRTDVTVHKAEATYAH